MLAMVVTILAIQPFFFIVLVPIIANRVGRFLGFTLRKRTEGRRAQLTSVMDQEDDIYWKENPERQASGGQEWEAIGRPGPQTTSKDGKPQKDWDGIIGFFHPFWCVEYTML